MSDQLILRGHARPLAVAPTASMVAGLLIVSVVTADYVASPAMVITPLAFAAWAAWIVFLALDNWSGWLSIARDDGDWVIIRGSVVRRPSVLRVEAARITFVEKRLEERAPIYALVMGPRRENEITCWGPIVRVHLERPPVGARLQTSYVDLGKWLDLDDEDLERLRALLAGG